MPPPTGVVRGPLIEIRNSWIAASVSSGNQLPNFWKDFSPAKTSYQTTLREPFDTFSIAASKTSCEAFQISRPVPSPSMKGIIGLLGTTRFVPLKVIFCPDAGTSTPLNFTPLPPVTKSRHPGPGTYIHETLCCTGREAALRFSAGSNRLSLSAESIVPSGAADHSESIERPPGFPERLFL